MSMNTKFATFCLKTHIINKVSKKAVWVPNFVNTKKTISQIWRNFSRSFSFCHCQESIQRRCRKIPVPFRTCWFARRHNYGPSSGLGPTAPDLDRQAEALLFLAPNLGAEWHPLFGPADPRFQLNEWPPEQRTNPPGRIISEEVTPPSFTRALIDGHCCGYALNFCRCLICDCGGCLGGCLNTGYEERFLVQLLKMWHSLQVFRRLRDIFQCDVAMHECESFAKVKKKKLNHINVPVEHSTCQSWIDAERKEHSIVRSVWSSGFPLSVCRCTGP